MSDLLTNKRTIILSKNKFAKNIIMERVKMDYDYDNRPHQRMDLLERARLCWEGMSGFREERERNKRFTYGDQWGDMVETPSGRMREEEYIRMQGNMPLKNNLIRRLVRNVLGVFRNRWTPPRCVARDPEERGRAEVMQRLLDYNMEINRLEEVYARTMEEFLISGMAVHRKWFGTKGQQTDCWTDAVSPENFFIDTDSRDFRNWDVSLIGELHDMEFPALCAAFARGEDDYDRLLDLYSPPARGDAPSGGGFGSGGMRSTFQTPSSSGACRVIEVWTREYRAHYRCHDPRSGEWFRIPLSSRRREVEEENRRRRRRDPDTPDSELLIKSRWIMEEEWHYHFLTPDGYLLAEGITPYRHGRHPYVVKAYPFIDGEIHSFVGDIIDQQKFTNRLISMYDWILRASAKGVLLFPEGALPDGVEIADVAEEWSRFNGVIVFRPRAGMPLPQQVSSNATNIGITDLLNIQMKMMEDISGVNGALQGKLDSSSMSGTLYDQQTRNSLTSLADLLKSYTDFILDASAVDVSNIRQYYDDERLGAVLGESESLAESRNFFDSTFDFSLREGEPAAG